MGILRNKRLWKWARRGGIVLLALCTVFVVSVDRWRAAAMADNRERLEASFARLDEEILKGQSPSDWHKSRIRGTNGWEHVAFIHDICRLSDDYTRLTPEDRVITEAVRNLSDFQNGHWEARDDDPDAPPITDPSSEQLDDWLNATQSLADAYARAVEADCIVMLPLDDEPYPQWFGVRVAPRYNVVHALFGRCKALVALGRPEQAWTEFEAALKALQKYGAPMSFVDGTVTHAMPYIAAKSAVEMLVDGTMHVDQARRILDLHVPTPFKAIDALEGEAVWLYVMTQQAGFLTAPPGWFDWLIGDLPLGDGMFAHDDFNDSAKSRWAAPINLGRQVANAMDAVFELRNYLDSPSAWDPAAAPVIEDGLLVMTSASLFNWRNGLIRRNLAWLELELRILELEQGPLVNLAPQVAETVSRYPGAEYEFDEDDLRIGVAAKLQDDARAVGAWGEEWDHWLYPVEELRNPPEVDIYD
jgi:hypothetical protein